MKRKPIYIVRLDARGLVVRGRITIETSGYVSEDARRAVVAAFVEKLRTIGLEATPKQPEAHR